MVSSSTPAGIYAVTSSPTPAGIYVASSVLFVISSACVALRYCSRRIKAARWATDDWLVFAALLLQLALAIILVYGASQRVLGYHTLYDPETGISLDGYRDNQLSIFGAISAVLTVLTLGALKCSVVMFYRRIFIGSGFKIASAAILVFIALWTLAFFLSTVLECNGHDLKLIWGTFEEFKTQCSKYKAIQLAHAASDIATDLAVLSLPLPPIWKLQMAMRKKVLISLAFLVGLISVAAGTARLAIVTVNIFLTNPDSRDTFGTETNVIIWGYVEVGVGIIAACLPTLYPIFHHRRVESVIASVRDGVSRVPLFFTTGSTSRDDSEMSHGASESYTMTGRVVPNHPYADLDKADSIYQTPHAL
ncbi:hypothetical protein GGR57DRAFT_510708 [Xylariaceae sp. FL1272]|nr:hypothetical protein GGR57DRAFT_510708 [Xylariaceae sp. FL1272]